MLPDRVARWIGVGGDSLGEESDHKAMVSSGTNIVYSGGGQGLGGGSKGVQALKDGKAQQAKEGRDNDRWDKLLAGGGGKVELSGGGQGGDKPNDGEGGNKPNKPEQPNDTDKST